MALQHIDHMQRDSLLSSPPYGTKPFPVGVWSLDPDTTMITVSVRNWMFARARLVLDLIEGEVEVDQRGVIRGIRVIVASASVDSGNERRDNQLRGAHFLDVAAHPTIFFSGRSTGDRIAGELAVKDHEAALPLTATEATLTEDGAATFAAHGTVDRRKIGLGSLPGTWIGHQLEVALSGSATSASTARLGSPD